MRDILTVSLPTDRLQWIKDIVKKRKFKSVSDYINFSIDQEQKMISEDQVLIFAKQAKKEYATGKTHSGLSALHKIA
jgi:Arc/MetJ-type ribon-helix-helix transcriptional regulator